MERWCIILDLPREENTIAIVGSFATEAEAKEALKNDHDYPPDPSLYRVVHVIEKTPQEARARFGIGG